MISSTFQWIVVLVTGCFFWWLLSLLKKKRLNLKYTLLWFASAVMMLVMGAFPQILNWISGLLGIYNPTNALFAMISLFLILLCLSLTVIVSKQNEVIKRLAQRMAMIEKQQREDK